MPIQRTIRRNPWRDLDTLTNRLTMAFDGPAGSSFMNGAWQPAVSVQESPEELLLVAELPGLSEADIELEVENNVLTLRGEKTEVRSEEGEGHRIHIQERRHGRFTRRFTLPRSVSTEGISADFDNGLLSVRMPKMAEARSRRIEIGAGTEVAAAPRVEPEAEAEVEVEADDS